MKKNVNTSQRVFVDFINYPDNGQPVLCAVDNFPGDNPAYVKKNGFRCNDISLLDRLSFSQVIDEDLAKIVASRVKEISVLPSPNMSESELLKTLRPSYVQTAAEVKDWDEMVYQYISTTQSVTVDDVKQVNSSGDVGSVNDDSSTNNVE